MDFTRIAGILTAAIGAAPPFLAFGWDAWERLRAAYVPQEDVDRLASDCIAEYGPGAMRFVNDELDDAKRQGKTGEYWLLIRVKEALEGMKTAGGAA